MPLITTAQPTNRPRRTPEHEALHVTLQKTDKMLRAGLNGWEDISYSLIEAQSIAVLALAQFFGAEAEILMFHVNIESPSGYLSDEELIGEHRFAVRWHGELFEAAGHITERDVQQGLIDFHMVGTEHEDGGALPPGWFSTLHSKEGFKQASEAALPDMVPEFLEIFIRLYPEELAFAQQRALHMDTAGPLFGAPRKRARL